MSTERRKFRPFDVPGPLEHFFSEARLVHGSADDTFAEPFSRLLVGDDELRAGNFVLEITRTDSTFADLLAAAQEAVDQERSESIDLVIVVSSSYLKVVDVVARHALSEVTRVVPLTNGRPARPFHAVFHGCDVEAFLVLAEQLDEVPLRPWRKATWLSRVRFELRTGLDGVGFNILPLTDDERSQFHLPPKALRYVSLDESPLLMTSVATVNLYVDAQLLARLRREPSKDWAKAFADQLAVDVLSAIALKAVSDPAIRETEWSGIADTLLGALIEMVDGNTGGDEAETLRRRQALLEQLRDRPNRFVALIEGICEMRDAGKRLVGGSW